MSNFRKINYLKGSMMNDPMIAIMKNLTAILFCLLTTVAYSQIKYDYYWPMGNDQGSNIPGVQGFAMDFSTRPMQAIEREGVIEFDRTIGTICDSNGDLLFYTNGVQVVDRFHQPMQNGDSLNQNNFLEELWPREDGFPEKQGLTVLTDPTYEDGYYIIHKPVEFENVPAGPDYIGYEHFLYSYVDMSLNNGLGGVTIKNDTLAKDKSIASVHMAAINHSDGESWWILNPSTKDTGMYYRILIDRSGVNPIDSQYVGPNLLPETGTTLPEFPITRKARGGGYSRFSPDGSMYAYFNLYDGLHLYDFDRSTGLLSNVRTLPWEPIDRFNWAGCVEFSPNSELLYLSNIEELYQIDLSQNSLEEGMQKIAVEDTSSYTGLNSFFMMAMGPDCKIYLRGGSSVKVMNTIHNPNGLGQDCDLRIADLTLPRTSSTGGFPNFPPFRVDQEEKCDSTITMVNGVNVFWRRDLNVYPNPATDRVAIDLPQQSSGYLRITNIDGVIVRQEEITMLSQNYTLSISELISGIYYVDFLPKDNSDKVIYTSKIVKL